MSHGFSRWSLAVGTICMCSGSTLVFAVDKTWTPTIGASFFENANWVPAGAPGVDDKALVLDPTVEALINFTGTRTINSFHLGETDATGGRVRFNAGELQVHAENNARSHVGDRNSMNSTFVMEGTAVLLFDHPLDAAGAGLGFSAGDEDLEIGARRACRVRWANWNCITTPCCESPMT